MNKGLWSYKDVDAIHLEITNRCNAGCPMCPRYINSGTELNPNLVETDIRYDDFVKWFDIDFVSRLKKLYACGNYGDPIAAKDTLPIFKYLRENNSHMALMMHTNASARSPEWFYELGLLMNYERRGDACVFSVDGLDDTNHLYRKNTNFDKILANMKAYREAGGIAQWDYIAFKHNAHQIDTARQLAKDLGFTKFNLKKTTRWGRYDSDGLGYYEVPDKNGNYLLQQPTDESLRNTNADTLKKVFGIVPNYVSNEEFDRMYPQNADGNSDMYNEYDPSTGKSIEINFKKIEVSCRAVNFEKGGASSNNEIFVSAEGEVYPCCFLGGEPNRYVGSDSSGKENIHSDDSFMKMLELNGGRESIDLHNHTLSSIIESDLYQRLLPRSFELDHNMRSKQCTSCCGKEWNKLDNGELGNPNAEDAQLT
jgi:MoaA/NifB/PqqE/SkfB family radical SAM enzyme